MYLRFSYVYEMKDQDTGTEKEFSPWRKQTELMEQQVLRVATWETTEWHGLCRTEELIYCVKAACMLCLLIVPNENEPTVPLLTFVANTWKLREGFLQAKGSVWGAFCNLQSKLRTPAKRNITREEDEWNWRAVH